LGLETDSLKIQIFDPQNIDRYRRKIDFIDKMAALKTFVDFSRLMFCSFPRLMFGTTRALKTSWEVGNLWSLISINTFS